MTSNDKVNILLVDDQPSKLLTYEVILRELGENLIKAASGKEALEQLLKNEVAVILMDVSMFRALPPLVIVLIVYFGLPNVGISIPSFAVLWLVLTLVLAAFAEEIFWAGILSVPKGQWEAARSTGFGFLGTLGWIVLPQAVRLTVPPITNRTVAITKNTALGTVIGVPEILNQATSAQSFSGNATPLMMGAIAYLILFIPVVALGRFLETRFAWRRS